MAHISLKLYSNHSIISDIPCGIINNPEKRIVGGNETRPYSMPWTVALVNEDSSLLCGGVIISSRYILTAAHCTIKLGWEEPFSVMVGEHFIRNDTDGVKHSVASVMRHPEYTNSYLGNDIAIVTLDEPIQLGSRAVHACLPSSSMDDTFLSGKTLTASGWGRTSVYSPTTDVLHSVQIPYVNISTCQSSQVDYRYRNQITSTMICTGDLENGGVDTCLGDSGGKFVITKNFW